MASNMEQLSEKDQPIRLEVIEKPLQYPLDQLQETFELEDIKKLSEHQDGISKKDPRDIVGNFWTEEFLAKYGASLPLLTFNVSRYPEIEEDIANDDIIQAMVKERDPDTKVRTIRARRSILALVRLV